MTDLATTPEPPYYAVIFTNTSTSDGEGYAEAAARMRELAMEQPGYLGFETARDDTTGISVSYWESEEAIGAWKAQAEHAAARTQGRERWYDAYELRVARVERAYGWVRSD